MNTPIDHQIDFTRILEIASKMIGKHGRVVFFLSTPPVGFYSLPIHLDLIKETSVNWNSNLQNIQRKFLENYSRVDFLIHSSAVTSIDYVSLHKFCRPMKGQFVIIERFEFNHLIEVIKKMIDSRILFVKLVFLNSLKTENMLSQSYGIQKKCCINSLTFSMNSNWTKIIDFEMVSMGPKTLPFQIIVNYRKNNGFVYKRVFHHVIQLTDDLKLIYNNLNEMVILKSVINKVIKQYKEQNETDLKNLLNFAIKQISPVLRGYRNHISVNKNVFIPDSLSNLCNLILGAMKSSAFLTGFDLSHRMFYMDQVEFASCSELKTISMPVLADITDYLLTDGPVIYNSMLTRSKLHSHRLYLLYDGFSTYIFVGNNIPHEIMISVFSAEEMYQVVDIVLQDNEMSRKIFSLLSKSIKLCVENGVGMQTFLNKLNYDRTMNLPSYQEFLTKLQKEIIQGS